VGTHDFVVPAGVTSVCIGARRSPRPPAAPRVIPGWAWDRDERWHG
jgi:hypothetical protein